MYRVETKSLRELLRMWLEDNPERKSSVQTPPRGQCYTSITDEYGCIWMGSDDAVPAHLVDRVVEHYLNERSSRLDTLIGCSVVGEAVQLVWRAAE